MRELTLQKRLGHASAESTKIDTRVSDDAVQRVVEQGKLGAHLLTYLLDDTSASGGLRSAA